MHRREVRVGGGPGCADVRPCRCWCPRPPQARRSAARARLLIAPYAATKGAVGNLTEAMATDRASHGPTCNAIARGYSDTPLNAARVAGPAFCVWLEQRIPAGRWGRIAVG